MDKFVVASSLVGNNDGTAISELKYAIQANDITPFL